MCRCMWRSLQQEFQMDMRTAPPYDEEKAVDSISQARPATIASEGFLPEEDRWDCLAEEITPSEGLPQASLKR
ncbi:hypothetical protein Ddc_00635 [Ditylenchus destructor]|nr:hypothetical protein Ddc_00635 [Ditylenchus destructor]